jgi:hypothetical protein
MILLQAGGNDAGVARVAYACVFAPTSAEYGFEYPNPDDQCAKEPLATAEYVFDKGRTMDV